MLIASALPRPTNRNINPDAPCPDFGWPNIVSRARVSSIYFPEHAGALSIKCAFHGQEIYEAEGKRFAVGEGKYLILNEGQRYSSCVEEATEIESFCVFFRLGLASEVLRSLVTSADHLLDAPGATARQPVQFLEQLYPHDSIVSPILCRIHALHQDNTVSVGEMETLLHLLLERMLIRHRDIRQEIAKLSPVRWATKVELYTRLHQARDFMEATLERPLMLTEIAQVACLSPHHFLRQFKEVFQVTPHAYLTRKRLERAKWLLTHSDQSVSTICYLIGFESLTSFSGLFHRHFGMSPAKYRRAHSRPRWHISFSTDSTDLAPQTSPRLETAQ